MEKETQLLEINLIFAQGLKTPSANLRRLLQTYATAWVDPSSKHRTRIDRVGGENPTWNEKFLFRVTSDFLSGETSGITVQIYAKSYIKDPLLGTVRFLLNNCFCHGGRRCEPTTTPALTAAPPDDSKEFLTSPPPASHRRKGSNMSEKSSGANSCDLSSCGDASDGNESSSSSNAASTALKDLNNEAREEL